MNVDIYENKYSTSVYKKMDINHVFETIKSNSSKVKKEDRLGAVYASSSSKGRKHEYIKNFTGLAFIDIDNCSDPKKVKAEFMNIDCTFATWFSSSGNVHSLIKIPISKDKD